MTGVAIRVVGVLIFGAALAALALRPAEAGCISSDYEQSVIGVVFTYNNKCGRDLYVTTCVVYSGGRITKSARIASTGWEASMNNVEFRFRTDGGWRANSTYSYERTPEPECP